MPRSERPDMAAYGVPDEPDGLLPWSWAEARLAASRNFWLATVSGDGRPHAMPVWGVWVPEREVFAFGCDPSARKARNLTENERVVVTGEDTVHVVSIEGRARRVDDAEVDLLIRAFVHKYRAEPGFDDQEAMVESFKESAFYAVDPERAFGIIEEPESFGPAATRWVWA